MSPTLATFHIYGRGASVDSSLSSVVTYSISSFQNIIASNISSSPFTRPSFPSSPTPVTGRSVTITLLFLTPLFHYTPLVVLSSIIMVAMIGVIDYEVACHLWGIDKFDLVVCISAYLGAVFCSVETGLAIAVAMSLFRVLLFVARPRTCIMGNIPNSMTYRSIEQYPEANYVSYLVSTRRSTLLM